MIVIVISITVLLSVLLSAFVAFAPNFSALTESDFRRRAYESATHAGLKWGELKARAGTFDSDLTLIIKLQKDELSGEEGARVNQYFLKLELPEPDDTGNIKVNISRIAELPAEAYDSDLFDSEDLL